MAVCSSRQQDLASGRAGLHLEGNDNTNPLGIVPGHMAFRIVLRRGLPFARQWTARRIERAAVPPADPQRRRRKLNSYVEGGDKFGERRYRVAATVGKMLTPGLNR